MAGKEKKPKRMESNGANLGFEQKLWQAADKLFLTPEFYCSWEGVRLP